MSARPLGEDGAGGPGTRRPASRTTLRAFFTDGATLGSGPGLSACPFLAFRLTHVALGGLGPASVAPDARSIAQGFELLAVFLEIRAAILLVLAHQLADPLDLFFAQSDKRVGFGRTQIAENLTQVVGGDRVHRAQTSLAHLHLATKVLFDERRA